jgi:hypothetical protein
MIGMKHPYKMLADEPEKENHLGNQSIDGRMLLECILNKQGKNLWTGFIWLRIGSTLVNWAINLRVP